ncbi:MAG: hypothetical protein H8D23_33905 [Candidatus Brocadiales bacterium]|nr:hypothetical protein [Candidatus Brocadiales bacterium]
MIDLIADGTTVYAITYNVTADIVSVSLINISASSSSIINTFSSTVAPTAVHFVSTGATPADKHFIFVYPDSTQSYKNSFRTLPDLSTATDMVDPVFDRSDDAAKNSPIIGAYAYGTTIYLITNEGILITSDDNLANFAAVNKADSSEFMSLVLNPTGSTAADFSVPMTIVTKGDTTKLLIMGGISGIYYYDITGLSTDIPIKFSSEDAFYSNVSSTHILDFYNVPIDADFSLYTATSDKWIWETVDENTASSQLL